jgi:hypothetical protein
MSSLLVICLGWCSNFVGSESGQKQSVKLLQNMVYSTIQHPPPQVTHIVCIYCTVYILFGKGDGGGGGLREGRGATVHKYCSFVHGGNSSQAGSKIQTTEWMYLQSIKSVKHNAAMSVVPRVRWRRLRRGRITPRRLLSWPCVSDLLYLKARAGYALQPSMTRKPQLQSYTIRVWSYETFIVSASSSSG